MQMNWNSEHTKPIKEGHYETDVDSFGGTIYQYWNADGFWGLTSLEIRRDEMDHMPSIHQDVRWREVQDDMADDGVGRYGTGNA